jgi:hypothetical protein
MRYLRRPNTIPIPPPAPTAAAARAVAAPSYASDLSIVAPQNLAALPLERPSFALAISHCPWRPDRAQNMVAMRDVLKRFSGPYHEETERAPNHVWSRRMWGWGARQSVTHTVYLQDDLVVAPRFWYVVEAMVRAVSNHVIGLISNHPMSERALAGGDRWYRMCETLGSGYIVPTDLMRRYLPWRDAIPEHEAAAQCEDFLFTKWQYLQGLQSWCPVPSVIQTRDDIQTTNPTIAYPYRQSYLTWEDPRAAGFDLSDEASWRPRRLPPDFGICVTQDTRFPLGRGFSNDQILAQVRAQVRAR